MEKALSYKYDENEGQAKLCLKKVQQIGGSFDRKILSVFEELDLPKFQRARREHYGSRLHGREQ